MNRRNFITALASLLPAAAAAKLGIAPEIAGPVFDAGEVTFTAAVGDRVETIVLYRVGDNEWSIGPLSRALEADEIAGYIAGEGVVADDGGIEIRIFEGSQPVTVRK